MVVAALVMIAIAGLCALYIAKQLVIDVAWHDHRVYRSSSTARMMVVSVVIAAAVLALPAGLGLWLVMRHHPVWAIVVAIGSLGLSLLGFIVLAAGAKP